MTDFPTLFDYEPSPMAHARHRDPETSKEAAESVDVSRGQAVILAAFKRYGPSTDEQLFARLEAAGVSISPSGARSRRNELVIKGKVQFSGRFDTTSTGRKTRIWELAE